MRDCKGSPTIYDEFRCALNKPIYEHQQLLLFYRETRIRNSNIFSIPAWNYRESM